MKEADNNKDKIADTEYADKIHEASQTELKLDLIPDAKEVIAAKVDNNPRKVLAAHKVIEGKLKALNELIKCK